MPSVRAFKVPDKPIDMLMPDLEDAEIPYVDDAGRYADFHALRHTTGSFLVASGGTPENCSIDYEAFRHKSHNGTVYTYFQGPGI